MGRQQEMAQLSAALYDALSGHGRIVMLVGEPGIGKTRTAQELAALAETRGAQLLWGRCYEEQGAPPYWPWVQPIRGYVQQAAAEQLTTEMGPGAANIAEIIPELRGKLPDLETPRTLEPGPARFRLFDSIATFLKNAAQRQPLMLVLDDLHWADRSSLLLLEFLAQEIGNSPLLLLGAHRDVELSRDHPLSQTLGALVREQLFHRVQLDGLTRQEVGELVEGSAGITLTPEAAEVVHNRTDGNPFFVGEVTRQVTLENITQDETWASTIPEGVRDAIGRRLNRLSDQCNQMLTTASIIGREFDFRLLIMLSGGVTQDQLLHVVEEAVSVHLIEDVRGQMDRYQFSHALIQQTVADAVTTSRRVRLHGRIAEALEALYGDDSETHAAELAHHFGEAQTSTGITKLVRYSLLAGERALAAYAYEDAITHFEGGLVARDIALSGTEAASDEQSAALLFGLVRARGATVELDQLGEAFATLSRAFEYYVDVGNVAQAVAAAEFPIAPPGLLIPGLAELLARAVTLVPADSHEAGRLLSRYGGILGVAEGDYEGAQQALGWAISIARREGDVALELQILANGAAVSGHHLHLQESVDNGLRAIELATGDETTVSEFLAHFWTAISLARMGDFDAARSHASVLRDLADRRSTPRRVKANCFMMITALSCSEGNWEAGRESSDSGLELAPLGSIQLFPRTLLEYETAESAQGEIYLQRLFEMMRRAGPQQLIASGYTSVAIATIARITGVPDRLEVAEAAAEHALSAQSVTPLDASYAQTCLTLLAVQKGDQSAAEEHYAYLLGHQGTMMHHVSVDRLLSLLSQTMGNLDQAAAHFDDALSFCRKAGYRPELAWTCFDYADILLQRNEYDDRAKAITLLEESLAISSELGMPPLMERAMERLERAQSKPQLAPLYPDGLTQREVEVLRLIAAGKTDREIADELFISFRTVGNHVRSILNRTGTANRAQATRYAMERGLLSLDEAGSAQGEDC